MGLFVEIEDMESWPKPFYNEAIKSKALLIAYHAEESKISRMSEEDVLLRVNPPKNKFENDYKNLLESLEKKLIQNSLIGYHCTRLANEEIKSIKSNGLQILTEELIKWKLEQIATKYISNEKYEYLLQKKPITDIISHKFGHRTGMIWFAPNRSTLKEEHSVYRLFQSWGGEAIYVNLERDDYISSDLRQIGTSCIVKCAIPFADVKSFHDNHSARFISKLIVDDVECAEPPYEFDFCIKRNTLRTEVLTIIENHELDFERFTNYKDWEEKI